MAGSIWIEVPYEDDEDRDRIIGGEGAAFVDAVVERGIVQTVEDGEHDFGVRCSYCLMEPFDLNGRTSCPEHQEET